MVQAVQVVHARVPASTVEQLRANALANDRTLAQELRRALRMYAAMLERQRGSRTAVQNGAGGSAELELEPTPEP